MKTLIAILRNGIDLTSGDINYAMSMLLSESTEDGMKAEFLMALHRKGESVEEIVAFVQQLIDRAIDPLIDPKNLSGPMLDVCGTGGDGLDLFNVSTTIMFVLAIAQKLPGALMLALVVFLAMTGSCLMSSVCGALVPLTLKKLGADPAVASSILVTTATDMVSMGLLLGLATLLV